MPLQKAALVCLILAASLSRLDAKPKRDAAPILLISDYGLGSSAAAICKANILQVSPQANIIDISHQIPSFGKEAASQLLSEVAPYYPADSVFMVAVDVGSQSSGKAVVVKTKSQHFIVAPNNGVASRYVEKDGSLGIREIWNEKWMRKNLSGSAALGREVLCPVVAHLAMGADWKEAGPVIPGLVKLTPTNVKADKAGFEASVVIIDSGFGNVTTNVSQASFSQLGYWLGDEVKIKLNNREVKLPYVSKFKDAGDKKALVTLNPDGQVLFAVNRGNFAQQFGVKASSKLFFFRKGHREVAIESPAE